MSENKLKDRVLNWEDVDMIMASMAHEVRRLHLPQFEAVIGIARGGLVPATILSHKLNLPLIPMTIQLRDGKGPHCDPLAEIARVAARLDPRKRVLIVDDINDSGKTLQLIQDNWPKNMKRPITAVMCERASSPFAADIVGFTEDTGRWLLYAWEY